MKSTLAEIRDRFDQDVERFSNLQTGQSATMDAALCMDLLTQAAARTTPQATSLLDIGCGAGNYTLKLLEKMPALDCTLIDLSEPMLRRAVERIRPHTTGRLRTMQQDMLSAPLVENEFDIVLAAATLHHLREPADWAAMFTRIFRALRPGGSFWIFDLISHEGPIESLMQERYGDYLVQLKGGGTEGQRYRDTVFAYIEKEDSPRPLLWQIDQLRTAGFTHLDILHKNACFAAFGAVKAAI